MLDRIADLEQSVLNIQVVLENAGILDLDN